MEHDFQRRVALLWGAFVLQRQGTPLSNLSVNADALPPLLVGEALAILAKFSVLPEAPLLGELSNEVRLRGCTKDSFRMRVHISIYNNRKGVSHEL